MGWRAIVRLVFEALSGASSIVTAILRRTGHLNDAQPWLSLGTVGVRYLGRILSANDEGEVLAIISKSPTEIWKDAKDVETENAIIRQVQLDRIDE